MSSLNKELSSPFLTGGGGFHFESHVQSTFVILMLIDGYLPCISNCSVTKIKLQGKYEGFDTDDIIIFTKNRNTNQEKKLLAQIKTNVTISKNNSRFFEVISSAWKDFNNSRIFNQSHDQIVLIQNELTKSDIQDTRFILELARSSENSEEYFVKIEKAKFISQGKKNKLEAFICNIKKANNGVEVSKDIIFRFLRCFHLHGYDLDIKHGVIINLFYSLIQQHSINNAESIWLKVLDEVQSNNKYAGTITKETLPKELVDIFKNKNLISIPEKYLQADFQFNLSKVNFDNKSALLTATIIGSWDESKEGDMEITNKFAGPTTTPWIESIRYLHANQDNQPSIFILKNSHWQVKDKVTLWNRLSSNIFDSHLNLIKECSVKVLSETHPKFDIAPSERFAAEMKGYTLKYSDDLKEGLSETLALIGAYPERLINCSKNKREDISLIAIREIFQDASWKTWATLSDYLPTLAEASPEAFLDAVEDAIRNKNSSLRELFNEENGNTFGECNMSGLLWALESLAWTEEYLLRVTIILSKLDEIDPGGRWANRPINSLVTIFLPWYPQTLASTTTKINALKAVVKQCKNTAWKIIFNLLPNRTKTSCHTHKPKLKSVVPPDWEPRVTNENYSEEVETYTNIAIDLAKDNLDWILKLVDNLQNLPHASFSHLLEYLSSKEILSLEENSKTKIWEALQSFINVNRRFADTADWALPFEQIDKIESVAKKLTPSSLINFYRGLFVDNDFELFDTNESLEEQRNILNNKRQSAIQSILETNGIESIDGFVESVEAPSVLGLSLSEVSNQQVDKYLLPKALKKETIKWKYFIRSYLINRYNSNGLNWLQKIDRSSWSDNEVCQLLLNLPFEREIWDLVEEWLGNKQNDYWQTINVNVFATRSDLSQAVDKLIQFNRPWLAIECLYSKYYLTKEFDAERTIQAFLLGINSDEPLNTSRDQYNITELIKLLQDMESPHEKLAQIEWGYLPLLDGYNGVRPKHLWSKLASEPEFFCEIIRLLYRSDKEDTNNIESSNDVNKKRLASLAWKLLHGWKHPPGLLENGTYNFVDLLSWLSIVKKICVESGHLEVSMVQLGHVLYYVPSDLSGLWINKDVAELLDNFEAVDMRSGYTCEVFNSRGVHWVDPSGRSEKELSNLWRQRARDIEEVGLGCFAASLKKLADSYDRNAERIIDEHSNDE